MGGEGRLLFRPHHRLLTKSDFSNVFDNCQTRLGRGPVLLLAVPNKMQHPRMGLVTRKKFIKSAVARNRFKRIARERFRISQHNLPSLDIVIMNRSGSDSLTNSELHRLFAKVFNALAQKAS